MPKEPNSIPPIWTAAQRRVLVVLTSVFCLFLAGRYACNREYVPDPLPESGPRAAELADRIDPNTANWQTLAAIPGLGEKRARTIVEYREKWMAEHRGRQAFQTADDLKHVKGIGAAISSNLKPYLMFSQGEPDRTGAPSTKKLKF